MFGSLQLMPSRKEEDLTSVYGWMVAANPIGQMIFSPILGYVTAKRGGRIRMIGVGCAVTFIVGNVLYAVPSMLPEGNGRIAVLLISRFMTGASSGNLAPFRAYVVGATHMHERTTQLSLLAAFQV